MTFDEWSDNQAKKKKKKEPLTFDEWSDLNHGISAEQEAEDARKRDEYLASTKSKSSDSNDLTVSNMFRNAQAAVSSGSAVRSPGKISKKDEVYESLGNVVAKINPAFEILSGGVSDVLSGGYFQAGAFDDGYQFGDITKTILGTGADLQSDFAAGTAGIVENVIDAGAYGLGGLADLFGFDDFAEGTKNFIEEDIIDEQAVGNYFVNTNPLFSVIGSANKIVNGESLFSNPFEKSKSIEKNSILGEKSDALVQSGGQLAGTLGLKAVGVPWWATTGVTSFGSEVEQAFKEDASYSEAGLSGLISAGSDILTEKLFGGSGLGEKGLINLEWLTSGISNKALKTMFDYGIDIFSEGSEEFVARIFQRMGTSLYKEENLWEILTSEEAIEEYVDSFIGGAALGGTMNASKAVKSVKSGRDYRTGLNANEQAVVDKLYDDAVKEKEADGNKLTKSDKAKLKEEIIDNLRNGQLDINDIERVLGGDDYTAYKDTVEFEDALKKELADLQGMEYGKMNDLQHTRLNELKGMNLDDTTKRNDLRKKLNDKVFPMLKDSYLAESYNEIARKGEAFEADLSKYKGKQKEAVQRAIDSGVLNNTYRSHVLVDTLSKIEADKGILFDYTNNAKLKETGFAVEGKTVNGYVDTSTGAVTLNVQSAKSWQSVVGHEITHVLEGTDAYTDLRNALYEFAESKGELESRRKSLTELYKDIENTDIEAELTADLVGDYLFTNKEFINRLTTNRNLFQKIYDEIKYLWNVATGKERADIEKVKKEFDKAWKEIKDGKVEQAAQTKATNTDKLTDTLKAVDVKNSLSNEAENIAPVEGFLRVENIDKILYNKNSPLSIANRAQSRNKSSIDWVYKAEIFSVVENKLFHEKISEINQGSQAFQKNSIDEYMIPIGNKIVFTNGDYDSPYIREIIEVLTDSQTEFEAIKECIYRDEKGESGKQDALRYVQNVFGKGRVISYKSGNDGVYGWKDGKRKGKTRRTVVRNYLNKYYGRRNDSQSNETEADLTGSASFMPDDIAHVDNIADIRRSLSHEAEDIAPVGDFNTPLNELYYNPDEAPVTEDIAPVQETISETETVAPVAEADKYDTPEMVEDIAPVNPDVTTNVEQDAVTEFEGEQGLFDGFEAEQKAPEKLTRSKLQSNIIDNIKSEFDKKGYDFDKVLKKAKNLSTFSTVDNTPQRVIEKSIGYKEGQILNDLTVNKVAQNETKGIKWLNTFTDRKNGLLAQISKQYGIKSGSKESAAAQMYAEGFYVDDNNDIVAYGDAELAQDFPNARVRNNIKGLAQDPRIRQIYDATLSAINESRTRNAYPEIPRLDNYFLHFRAMEDTFSKLGLPFNPNDIRAKDLPTDLNGVTADLKPGQPYFASSMHRKGKRTSFDLLGGLEKYLTSAKNQIYHIDDIQTLRALRNYIADTYGQANGLENIDTLTEEEVQERIEQVYNSHLSTFAKFLNEEANVLAGKTALIDRGLEGIIGRRGITFLNTVNSQVGSNMVGFNVSSSLTNFLPVAQTFAKTNKFDFTKAFTQTVSNKIGSIFGKGDSFAEDSPVIIRRKGADRFYRTPFQKVGDAGYVFMSAVDNISTELIARTKYNELTRKGMDSQQAHFETDKWVSRLMGDRSLGQQPQLYNSKMLGIFTKFQLEVRNQLDSQFYDTIQEAKASNEDIENALAKNAKTAAKVTSTFVQLAVAQHLFGKAFESVAGYNPAFDIIEVLATMFGFDDDEESEDTVLDNIEQGFLELLEDLPYTSTFTGGRIPISSALPIEQFVTGKDDYGNEKSRLETLAEAAPYYILPTGYGQFKKTYQGLKMFNTDEKHPVVGSYTNKGNLRFPVEDTIGNRIQAGLFGQYANENAREYFDNDYAPLEEKQIQEYMDVDLPIGDYWKYREGLTGLKTNAEKADYINSLDISDWQKNLLMNNLLDRKEDVDMSNYDDYSSWEEFDFAQKYPEKYAILQEQGISVSDYKKYYEESAFIYTDTFSTMANNPEKYTLSKAVTDDLIQYEQYTTDLSNIKADKDANGKSISGSKKEKVIDYINNLDIDYGAKIILFRSKYPDDDSYNEDIINYLNEREDITYEEMVTILTELDFKVVGDTVYWD